jgi:separase
MSALSHIYLQRGSPREALYFLDQAFALAESIGAPGPACNALIGKAEILLVQGNLQECTDIISQALDYVPGIVREGEEETNAAQGQHGVHLAELKRICGDFSARTLDDSAARESYQEALQILDGISSEMNTWRIE